ncbi:MAG TPA: tetratricopeptide repeat protein [Steroidobacteraceae bacterium]|nr:tetratricopeptide repeat protein [Steroidobacteraceae bacterium]
MVASNRRRWNGCAAHALLAVLWLTWTGASAGEPGVAADPGWCRTTVQYFLDRASVMRRSDEHIVQLLNAKRFRQAQSALLEAVSRHGDPWAGYALGNLYEAGLGVPRNAESAFRWYLWSAEWGDEFAQRKVANAYLHGEGTKRDVAEAAYWFRIGIAPFQLAWRYIDLAQAYTTGRLTPVDRGKADYYLDTGLADLRRLANEPNGQAAYYLGLASEHGRGLPRNRAKTMEYLCRAASLRYAPAVNAIRHLGEPPE